MSKTILLADDSVTIQKVVELTFMDQDYEVVAVSNGKDALAMLGAQQPSLLIADVHMPGADGYEVCRRSKEIYPGLPVLLLVGTFEPFDEQQAVASGADGHLKKPFDSQDLLSQVEALTGGAAVHAAPPTRPPAPPAEAAAPAAQAAPPALEVSELEPPPLTEDSGATEVEIEPFPAAAAPEPAAAAASAEPDDDIFELPSVDEATAPAPTPAPAAEDKPVSSHTAPIALPDLSRPAEPATDEADEVAAAPPTPAATPAPAATATPAPAAASAPAAAPAPADTAAGNGSGSLSDQDVDRVARRVAELVGEKLLREVAWEVVPDLAELIIKERIRELESQVE